MDGRWKGRAAIEGEQVACVEIRKKYEKRSRVVGRGSVKCTANKVLALKKLELLLVRPNWKALFFYWVNFLWGISLGTPENALPSGRMCMAS